MKDVYAFHAVIGYFRSSGYFKLQPYLKNLKDIKILVGINVDPLFAEAQKKGMLFFGDAQKTKDEFLKWFIQDLKEAKYEKEVEDGIGEFIRDMLDGRIEVRAHTSLTIHAKFYLFLPEVHTEHSDGWVIMGSSNLTEAGLGIIKAPNYEMNIALKGFDDVAFSKSEFEKLWKDSTPILPSDVEKFKQKTHIGQVFTPFELYIKFLIEYFGKNIDYDPDTVGDLPKTYKKLSYQIDAVNQGYQMLLQHNGFFLADVVGLGKTVVAAMVAKRFLIANGSLNTKILVVYPPALEKNWIATFRQFGLDKHSKFISNGSLDKIVNEKDIKYWSKEDYDLVLVDEAHKFRNHRSDMFSNLQRICKAGRGGAGLVEGKQKKVVLISATPLNNRPQDIYYQLLLFQNARRSTLSKTNLQTYFGPLTRDYKEAIRRDEPDMETIKRIYDDVRENIISQITVRRTRTDLKKYPKYTEDLEIQGIRFPEIAPPRPTYYHLDSKLSKLFHHTIFYLTDKDKIGYFRYQAIRYLKEEYRELYYDQAILISKSLAAIMKNLMVKRLESSFVAFRSSLNNLLNATTRMMDMFEKNKVLVAPDLHINNLMEKGSSIEDLEKLIQELSIEKPQNRVFLPEDFEEDLIEGLKKDKELLEELVEKWKNVDQDPKLESLFKALNAELLHPSINPSGQLVIFTESTDTADYLASKLEKFLNQKVLNVSASNRSRIFETILENFDANYTGERKNDYKILITTDVLAEGINLHRANVLINYDTPWNATRLMQRIGRINRIGSEAGVIYNYSFYPSDEGDEEIKLYSKALVKLQAFHTAFGEDAKIYTHAEMLEQFELFKEGLKDDEDLRLQYLRFIREFNDNHPKEFKRIKDFPLKARTGRAAQPSGSEKGHAGSSIIFLKSPYKTEFFIVRDGKTESVGFLEAAKWFEAQAGEPGMPIPDFHFGQVNQAIQVFEKEFLLNQIDWTTSTDSADVLSKSMRKFLREVKHLTHKAEVKQAADLLGKLIDEGVHTPLPLEVKKIKQQLDKRQISLVQMENLIQLLANKYKPKGEEENGENDNQTSVDFNVQPDIVISETFIA
jgi:superfamily II DNA/RNA helicase